MKSTQRTEFDSLEVVRLGRTEWRISPAVDPGQVLGYIERQRAGRFEVVWMTDPMRWGYTETFDAALVAFGDSVRFAGEVFPQRATVESRPSRVLGAPVHRGTWVKPTRHTRVA